MLPVHNAHIAVSSYTDHQALRVLASMSSSNIVLQAQEIALNYHCKCEQYAHYASGSFFNFHGTAGVWRIR